MVSPVKSNLCCILNDYFIRCLACDTVWCKTCWFAESGTGDADHSEATPYWVAGHFHRKCKSSDKVVWYSPNEDRITFYPKSN